MKKTIVLLSACSLLALGSHAQSLKLAHVSSTAALESTQSYKNIMAEEKRIYADAKEQSALIQQQIIAMQDSARAKGPDLTEFEAKMIQGDIAKKQQDLVQLEQYMQGQLQTLNDRLAELMEVYKECVATVAKKHQSTYVFDSENQLLYADPSAKDITEEVKAELLKKDQENPVLK